MASAPPSHHTQSRNQFFFRLHTHWTSYIAAFGTVLLATLLRHALDPLWGESNQYVTYIFAIIFMAWYGGLGPSLLTLLFSFPTAFYFFVNPRNSVAVSGFESQVGAALYAVAGLFSIAFSEIMRASQRKADITSQMLARKQEALTQEIAERREAQAAYVELLRRFVAAQEAERQRISREMHDQCGQDLTAMRLLIKSLEAALVDSPPALETIHKLQQVLDRTTDELRHLALRLRPPSLDDLGLESAVVHYLETWQTVTGITVDFERRGSALDRIPGTVETALYRVLQESLTNIAKHAATDRASVVLDHQPLWVTLIVEDQGRGFSTAEHSATNIPLQHLGLLGMRERMQSVGGQLELESAPDSGTTIYARVPLKVELAGEIR